MVEQLNTTEVPVKRFVPLALLPVVVILALLRPDAAGPNGDSHRRHSRPADERRISRSPNATTAHKEKRTTPNQDAELERLRAHVRELEQLNEELRSRLACEIECNSAQTLELDRQLAYTKGLLIKLGEQRDDQVAKIMKYCMRLEKENRMLEAALASQGDPPD
ncbi:MAG: hypothetical protein ACYTAF_16040 [Planctomycetota bacterium]|jgi:hypothetical protein